MSFPLVMQRGALNFPTIPPTTGGGAVASVFGRIGAVVAAVDDYAASQVANDSGVAGAQVSNALDALQAAIVALVTGVSSVYGRAGAVVAAPGDYNAAQVINNSGVPGANVAASLDALQAAIAALVTGVSSVYGRAGTVVAAVNDYNAAQVANNSGVPGAQVSDALDGLQASIAALVTGVSSVYGRIGTVVAAAGDYSASQVTNNSVVPGASVAHALDALAAAIMGLVTGVSSVYGRVGVVVAASGDYNSSLITNASGVAGANVTAALDALAASIAALVTGVSSVYGRVGVVVAASGDYNSSLITNASGVAGANVTAALDALAASIAALVTGVSSVFGRTGVVVAAASDYDASQVDNDSSVTGATVADALDALLGGQGFYPGTPVSLSYDGPDTNPIPWLVAIPAGNNRLFSFQAILFAVGDEAIAGRTQSLLTFIFATFWRDSAGVLQGVGGPGMVAFPPLGAGTGGGNWFVLANAFSGNDLVLEIYPNSGTANNSVRARGVLTEFASSFALGVMA